MKKMATRSVADFIKKAKALGVKPRSQKSS
jgi:hypothetical protein